MARRLQSVGGPLRLLANSPNPTNTEVTMVQNAPIFPADWNAERQAEFETHMAQLPPQVKVEKLAYICMDCGSIGETMGDHNDRDQRVAEMIATETGCCAYQSTVFLQSTTDYFGEPREATAEAVGLLTRAIASVWVDRLTIREMPMIRFGWEDREDLIVLLWEDGPEDWNAYLQGIVGVAEVLDAHNLFVERRNHYSVSIWTK